MELELKKMGLHIDSLFGFLNSKITLKFSIQFISNSKSIKNCKDCRYPHGVCSLAWIGQRPPEPLTRVQIPADPSKTSLDTPLIIYQKNINSYYSYNSYGNYEL